MAVASRWRAGVVLVATVVGVGATARLGLWQLDRAAQKTTIQTQIDRRGTLVPLDDSHLPRSADAAAQQHYRRTVLRGHWLAEHTVYLDNRQMNGAVGFYVVTPLQLEGQREAVLVQRGWTPRNSSDRTALSPLQTPAGVTQVEGLIAPPPSRLFQFSAEASGPIRQNLDLGAYAGETRLELLPFSVLQSDGAATAGDGLLRQWTLSALNVQMNYGYAFQWFALSALMAGLYVWFQLIRPAQRTV